MRGSYGQEIGLITGDGSVPEFLHSGYQSGGGFRCFKGGGGGGEAKKPEETSSDLFAKMKEQEMSAAAKAVHAGVEKPMIEQVLPGPKSFAMNEREALVGGAAAADREQKAFGAETGLRLALQQSGTPLESAQNMIAMGNVADALQEDKGADKLNAATAGQQSWREAVIGIAGPGMGVAQEQAGGTIRNMFDKTRSTVDNMQTASNAYAEGKAQNAAAWGSIGQSAGTVAGIGVDKWRQRGENPASVSYGADGRVIKY